MYTLFYHPANASLMPHMLLREIGAPFTLELLDRSNNAQKSAAYLKLNPTGTIPVLVHEGRAIHETAAISLYLADRHPEAQLAPALDAPERGDYLKWMILITNALQTPFRSVFYPHEFVSDPAHEDSMKAATVKRLMTTFGQIATHLETNRYLLGDEISAADFYLFMFVRWGRNLATPPRNIPSLARHANELLARLAVRETFEVEGIAEPHY